MPLFLISLQCSVCLIWMFLALLRREKTLSQRILVYILLLSFITFLGDVCFFDTASDSRAMVVMDALSQFITPCVAPLIVMYVLSLYGRKIWQWGMLSAFAAPIALGVTSVILYCMIGIDDSAEMMPYVKGGLELPAKFDTPICHAHVFVEKVLFYAVVFVQVLAVIIYLCVNMGREKLTPRSLCAFLAGRQKLGTNAVLMFLFATILVIMIARCAFSTIYYCYPGLGIAVSAFIAMLIAILCNVAYNVRSDQMDIADLGGEKLVSLSEIPAVPESTGIQEDSAPFDDDDPNLTPLQNVEANNAGRINMTNEDYSKLLMEFNTELVIKKAFLEEDVTLNTMVERLGYNRSYLSYMVNKEFGMTFRDVVGQLRIEYAMQYMRENPEALQEDVAHASGFSGASAFNRKFSQIVGITPRLWFSRDIESADEQSSSSSEK